MPTVEDLSRVHVSYALEGTGRRRATGVTDSATQQRVIARRLAELQLENYHDGVKIEIPNMDPFLDSSRKPAKSGLTPASRKILGSKKSLANHTDDDPAAAALFDSIRAEPSIYPSKALCSICGYWGDITCIRCGAKYCGLACAAAHEETRCMKVYS